MARTRIDLLPVTLKELKVSAFHRGWVKLGMGVHLRARETPQGFDVRIRYGKDDVIKKSTVTTGDVPIGTRGTLRRSLICAGCNKVAPRNLYLGRDFRFFCAQCLGVDPWKVRVPIKWDLGEEIKFRQLLRRKVDQDILTFELSAMRTLTPKEFFDSRPYLVPEWMAKVAALDPGLHKKMLKVMHDRYKSAMMKRKVRYLSEKETEWLLDKLQLVIEKSSVITKKEITWLRNHQSQLRSKSSMTIPMGPLESQLKSQSLQRQQESCQSSHSGETSQSWKSSEKLDGQHSPSGNQPGSMSDQSSSLPSEIDCSSKKMSSDQAMSVRLVKEAASEIAPPAVDQDTTNEANENSSVPPVKVEEL